MEDMLRSRGLRVTRPRLAVLEVLADGGHLEVDEIADRSATAWTRSPPRPSTTCSARWPGPAWPGGSSRPAAQPSTSSASATTTTTWSAGAAARSPTSTARSARRRAWTRRTAQGFVVDEAEVTFWGLCPTCQRGRADDLNDRRGTLGCMAVRRAAAGPRRRDDSGCSARTVSPGGCTPSRSCGSPAFAPCSCRCCTRGRWPECCRTRASARIRGAGCSGPPSSTARSSTAPPRDAEEAGGRVRRIHARMSAARPGHRRAVPGRRCRPAALGPRHRDRVVLRHRPAGRAGPHPGRDRPLLRRAARGRPAGRA